MKNNKNNNIFSIFLIIVIIAFIIFTILKLNMHTDSIRNNVNSNIVPNIDTNYTEKESISIYTEPEYIETTLSTYSTNIYDNDVNRVENIKLAVSKINGTILNPNDEFSFNNTVGPMDLEHGFKESTVFDSEGNVTKAPGGGMCQISSTLYNAVLEANLEVIERHPHSRRVDYVPVDKDATIYYNTLDFKFKNSSNTPIKILASSNEYNVTIELKNIEQIKN